MSALVYEIFELNLGELKARIEKLNKRAAKLSLPEVSMAVGVQPGAEMSDSLKQLYPDTPLADIPLEHMQERKIDGREYHFRKLLVTVIGEPVVLTTEAADGTPLRWRLVAVLQHEPQGNIVRRFPDTEDVELGEAWRTAPAHCIHCGTKRQRKDTFLLHSPKDGLIQLGRNCLSDYTGHQNPQALAHAAEWLHLFRNLTENYGDGEFSSSGWQHLHTLSYLAFVSAAIRQDGWVSRAKAQDEGKQATADSAAGAMWQTPAYRKTYRLPEPEASDFATAQAAYNWVKDTLSQRDRLSDYEWNLVTAMQPYTSLRNIGIVASAVNAYRRETEQQLQAKAAGKGESQHVGQVGEKLEIEVTCTAVHYFEGHYGTGRVLKFVDEQGNVFVWMTGDDDDEPVGAKFSLKGTVKGHSEYKGVKETALTRCKMISVD